MALIRDAAGNHDLTWNGGTIGWDYSQKKIGRAAVLFDNTDDHMDVASPANLLCIEQDATIEFWVLISALEQQTRFFDLGDASHSGMQAIHLAAYSTAYGSIPAGNIGIFDYSNTNALYTSYSGYHNKWTHVAFDFQSGGTISIYLDGVLQTSGSITKNIGTPTAARVGADLSGSYLTYAWMDELRVSGSRRYTSGFTPSTTQFTSDANTELLVHFSPPYTGGLRGAARTAGGFTSPAKGAAKTAGAYTHSTRGASGIKAELTGSARGAHMLRNGYTQSARGACGYYQQLTAQVTGLHRLAADLPAYIVWIGTGSEADPTAAPDGTGATLTAALADAGTLAYGATYYVLARRQNQWGLISGNLEQVVFELDGSGDAIGARPSDPSDVTLTPAAGGMVTTKATYLPRRDATPATLWRLYVTTSGVDPDPDTDTPTDVTLKNLGPYAFLNTSIGPYADGTDVRVILRTATADAESIGTTVHQTTAETDGPLNLAGAIFQGDALSGQAAEIEETETSYLALSTGGRMLVTGGGYMIMES